MLYDLLSNMILFFEKEFKDDKESLVALFYSTSMYYGVTEDKKQLNLFHYNFEKFKELNIANPNDLIFMIETLLKKSQIKNAKECCNYAYKIAVETYGSESDIVDYLNNLLIRIESLSSKQA